MSGAEQIPVVVKEVVPVNDLITRFRFVHREGRRLPSFSGGAHTVVEMDDNGIRRRNPYSLMGDPADTSGYSISVRRDDVGRGGSLYMHRVVRPGMEMVISNPVNLFALDLRARKHLFIAGGIGITPFIAMMAQAHRFGQRFELHYAARSRSLGAYMGELSERYGDRVHLHLDDEGTRLDLERLLARQPLGTHVYICGPKPMLAWVIDTATALGWPSEAIHYEEFLAPPTGQTFEVELAASNKRITVGAHQSLLEAIEAAGVDAPYLCRGGACGQCETDVLACDGRILHNDHWLTDAQKAEGTKIMPCMSRFEGRLLVLDR
ncbi:Flavodoxin reductase (ferredoxin-NADPH reductase) family 1, Vanillate O-demethylase oxidoreductase [Rubellimicrobium mesophilum DSM 19309]|uniref:Flavodoxin reductase (Ferredoxin-NADPH reductase) family 1, Vanillate O-demethylase oxidoreductase n=1 Tax=Rubellimicrobium mesophilum DSM 19309 TaxID=442562 RepID=A0A017HL72_9RHOB|nr:PDR/VanB family oxidoreductase [Rubellimicrobium mesophilum]EYD75086.1 Flavodoxin reductase (ferredoxin-NADPH reductase) family 1, Vanillate O-demethylase oxidoreductase [Rubellimicrobium mesophilum DSM 19309]